MNICWAKCFDGSRGLRWGALGDNTGRSWAQIMKSLEHQAQECMLIQMKGCWWLFKHGGGWWVERYFSGYGIKAGLKGVHMQRNKISWTNKNLWERKSWIAESCGGRINSIYVLVQCGEFQHESQWLLLPLAERKNSTKDFRLFVCLPFLLKMFFISTKDFGRGGLGKHR